MKKLTVLVFAGLALMAARPAIAATITLTPSTAGVFGIHFGPSNCEPTCVYTAFGVSNDGSLALLYKANSNPFSEAGLLATSYSTVFANAVDDPQDATISWISGFPFASCPTCYLAIKDGSHDPSYYFYNLAAWNGKDTIQLTGFWPQQGAISHVSIWGTTIGRDNEPPAPVPEPATGLLLTLGLAGAAAYRRRQAARR